MRYACSVRHGFQVLGFAVVLAIALIASPPALAGVLPTGLPDNGLSAPGGGVMFDLTSAGSPLTVTSFDYYASSTAGTVTSVDVYFKSGTHVGFESTPGAWTFAGNAAGVSNGTTTLAPLNTPDVGIPAGQTVAVYLIAQVGGIRYDGVAPIQQTYSNADISLFGGIARSLPWAGTNFSPRVFAGNVYYDIVPEPACLGAVSIAFTMLLRRRV